MPKIDKLWDQHGMVNSILQNVAIPPMATIEQQICGERIQNIEAHISKEFLRPGVAERIKPKKNVAITVGSRGINRIDEIISAVVKEVRKRGGKPCIIPAMGSHGGATREGQKELIEELGVREDIVNAPIISGMETDIVGYTHAKQPVNIDANALAMDGIIVIGRIKPHSDFTGVYESGLMKMMAIGLGNQVGAQECHADGFSKMAEYVPSFGFVVLENVNIYFGIGIVENGFDQIHTIESILPEHIPSREKELLELARSLMAGIPIPEFDILILDKIGKNISGVGMDPHVTGRFATPYAHGGPKVSQYVVLDLSSETIGNAIGIGMADFSTRRVWDKLDLDSMYPNSLTSRVPGPSMIPVILRNDKMAIQAALHCTNLRDTKSARVVRIMDTAHVSHFMVSESLLPLVDQLESLSIYKSCGDLRFGKNGELKDLSQFI